ncbi:MAG: protein phosphatase 2C domain-containing protein [Oscillospiraceae bacterium]|nr:protein phosphatase 2C domain-containing protein [Oscillospiraceae bacterium]
MRTSPGRIREKNEDAVLMHPCGLYAVADGMGGHRAGEIASRMAVDTLAESLPCAVPTPLAFREAIELANNRIYADSLAAIDRFGMGTTLTALWADSATALIAQVGDSRAYLYRDNRLHLCTRDHSLVDELLRKKKITPEQARAHPQRSVITRALGVEESVRADVFEWDRQIGDLWLLCSDGLTDMLDDARIGAHIREHIGCLLKHANTYSGITIIEEAADALIADALEAGGADNITLILLLDDGEEVGA